MKCFRSRYLKRIRHLQVVVKHQERRIRELLIKHNNIDPLQHYYYKQRVKELEVVVAKCREEEFVKKYREERNYALELERQNEWLINHYSLVITELRDLYLGGKK